MGDTEFTEDSIFHHLNNVCAAIVVAVVAGGDGVLVDTVHTLLYLGTTGSSFSCLPALWSVITHYGGQGLYYSVGDNLYYTTKRIF